MALQGFEARIERMVDGVFSRAFRSSLKPIELGRRLVKDMDDKRTLDVHGRAVVPNVFTFSLSPADHHAFSAIEAPLVRELVDAAKEHARDEGYGFLGPLRVELRVDDALRSGRFVLTSEMAASGRSSSASPASATPAKVAAGAGDPVVAPRPAVVPVPAPQAAAAAGAAAAGAAAQVAAGAAAGAAGDAAEASAAAAAGAPPWANEGPAWGAGLPADAPPAPSPAAQATQLAPAGGPPPAAAAAPTPNAALVSASGERIDLTAGRNALIGRLPTCEVLLNDPNVSRRHAEVRPAGDGWAIVDLGSTNGTRVNGAPVSEHPLRDGDVITVGGTRLRFEVR